MPSQAQLLGQQQQVSGLLLLLHVSPTPALR
jgi:hypothetical protein